MNNKCCPTGGQGTKRERRSTEDKLHAEHFAAAENHVGTRVVCRRVVCRRVVCRRRIDCKNARFL